MVRTKDLETYLANARRWEQDLLLSAQASKRLAWAVAAVSCGLTALSVVAVAALAPLKSVEPFVIRVDNATGIVEAVSALSNGEERYDEAVTKYFLGQYVRAREGYSHTEAPHAFRTVSLFSSGPEQQRFADLYRGSNPESPQVALGRVGLAEIRVKTIALLGPNLASVRFLRETRRGDETKISHWIATVTFAYAPKAVISTADRLVNPLGFQVSEYRADPEVLP
jgi:type IV secretion system protein VirB8